MKIDDIVKNDKIDVVCVDMWQTIADVPRSKSAVVSIAGKLGIEPRKLVRLLEKESDIFTRPGSVSEQLSVFLLNRLSSSDIDDSVAAWRDAPKHSKITGSGRFLVDMLKGLGYPLVLVSNVDQYGMENFPDRKFLEANFDKLYLSYCLGTCKPSAKFFESVRRDFSTCFSRMLVVGDDPFSDQKAANTLGMFYLHPNDISSPSSGK